MAVVSAALYMFGRVEFRGTQGNRLDYKRKKACIMRAIQTSKSGWAGASQRAAVGMPCREHHAHGLPYRHGAWDISA